MLDCSTYTSLITFRLRGVSHLKPPFGPSGVFGTFSEFVTYAVLVIFAVLVTFPVLTCFDYYVCGACYLVLWLALSLTASVSVA